MNVRRCNITRVAIHEISGGAVRVFMCYSFLYKYVFAIIYRLAFLYIVVLFFVHHVQLIKQPERKRILFYYIILTIKKHCNYYNVVCNLLTSETSLRRCTNPLSRFAFQRIKTNNFCHLISKWV